MNLYRPELKRFRFLRWFDFRSWRLGMIAYVLNRVTALGLVLYLYIHLAVLSILLGGPGAWDPFVEIVRSPFFLFLDVILLAGLLIHGLNGLRVALTGFGFGVRAQKPLFVALMIFAAIALLIGALKIFTG
jgi:succinate dehydrogenase / fumarate reductase cytochrome b subunit